MARCPLVIQDLLTEEVIRSTIIVVVALAVLGLSYKLISRYISHFCRKFRVEPHVENSLRLVLRLVCLLAGTGVLTVTYGLPSTWFLGGTALTGAAIGFGSSQVIGNLMAGLYVIVARPLAVKDYVKIGDVEGQVEEISFNYTKIYTPSYNLMSIPNLQVMTSQVLNCTHEGLIKYTFPVSFGHEVPNRLLVERCIQPTIDEFYGIYDKKLMRKPEWYLESSDRLDRTFKIRMFVPKGEAKTLYALQSELLRMIVERWDLERKVAPS
jgi:small-conductance mechanosensitive channel